jgi:hypothetical protein
VSYCPRSSLPAHVLAWLAARLARLLPSRPPGKGGTPPLPVEVRLDAVAAVLLDGLSYRRAGRAVGISKTEVGDSLDLLLGPLGALGSCQPDGTFVATLADLRRWLGKMAASGEAVCLDRLATRVQRPSGWANQKVLYDPKRHTHTAHGLALSTIWGACSGWTVAGQAAATSRSCWDWQAAGGAGRCRGRQPAGPGVPRHGQDARALAYPGRGPLDRGVAGLSLHRLQRHSSLPQPGQAGVAQLVARRGRQSGPLPCGVQDLVNAGRGQGCPRRRPLRTRNSRSVAASGGRSRSR